MRQEFYESVGQVVQAETVTLQILKEEERLLVAQERIELNAKAKLLHEEFGEPSWETWRFLHRVFGVEKVDELRLVQRDAVNSILDLRIECAKLKKEALQQRSNGNDAAKDVTALLLKNSELTSQQKEFKAHLKYFKQSAEDEKRRADNAIEKAEKMAALAEKNERLLIGFQQKAKPLEEKCLAIEAHAKNLKSIIFILVASLGGLLFFATNATKRANIAEVKLKQMEQIVSSKLRKSK